MFRKGVRETRFGNKSHAYTDKVHTFIPSLTQMTPHTTPLHYPPVVRLDDRVDIDGQWYQHMVLEPRAIPLQDVVSRLPGLEEAVQKVLDPTKGEQFPGVVRTTWLDTVELGALYPQMHLSTLGALYYLEDPHWLPPHRLVCEYEGEMLVKEVDGELVRSHFRTVLSEPGATPTLLLASAYEMLTVYSHLNFPTNEKPLIPLIALAGDTLTLGGFYIDEKLFQVTRGVPSGLKRHICPEQLLEGLNESSDLMRELSPSPWSRARWPVIQEGQLTWMTMTCFV